MLFFCLAIPIASVKADVVDTDMPVASSELPSSSYLKREKRSIASNTETSALAAPARGFLSRSASWEDPFLPGDGETSNPGNVGGPVGDVTLPIVLSMLFLYIIYKGVSTSKRRNNF